MLLTLEKFIDHFKNITINNKTQNLLDIKNSNIDVSSIITKQMFVTNLIITYKGNPTLSDLFNVGIPYVRGGKEYKSVIKNTSDKRYIDRNKIIDYLYDIVILNRFKYLESFYYAYFSFEDPYSMKWAHNNEVDINVHTGDANNYLNKKEFTDINLQYMENDSQESYKNMVIYFNKYLDQKLNAISMQKNDNSRRIIRNLNYLDILHTTKVTNTCKSIHSFWESLTDVYNKLILADRFFAPSSIELFFKQKNANWEINYNNFFYLFQQYQPKASILNPYTISYVFKHHLQGKRLFTPVLSWSSYIVSYIFSDYTEYVGVDVIPEVCSRSEFLFNYLINLKSKDKHKYKDFNLINKQPPVIYCQPSESLLYDSKFISLYTLYFDTIIMCPPYFDMEIYSSGEQSIKNYPNYEEWLDKYWETTVALCYKVLRIGGKFSFIVNNYDSLKGESYPLINDFNLIALKYFKLKNCFQLVNRGSPLRMNFKDRTEMLFIYEKYD